MAAKWPIWVEVSYTNVVKANSTNYKIDINCSVDCSTKNVIYMLGCRKCPQQYIGETERMLKERFLEHRSYVSTNNQTKSTGAHFTSKGHSISDMEITIVEKMFNQDPQYRKQREKLYIQKFNTKYKGLNRINGGWRMPIAILKKMLNFNLV